jgi:hypothetical protein
MMLMTLRLNLSVTRARTHVTGISQQSVISIIKRRLGSKTYIKMGTYRNATADEMSTRLDNVANIIEAAIRDWPGEFLPLQLEIAGSETIAAINWLRRLAEAQPDWSNCRRSGAISFKVPFGTLKKIAQQTIGR